MIKFALLFCSCLITVAGFHALFSDCLDSLALGWIVGIAMASAISLMIVLVVPDPIYKE